MIIIGLYYKVDEYCCVKDIEEYYYRGGYYVGKVSIECSGGKEG